MEGEFSWVISNYRYAHSSSPIMNAGHLKIIRTSIDTSLYIKLEVQTNLDLFVLRNRIAKDQSNVLVYLL